MVAFPVRSPGFLMSHNAYRSILPRADAPLPERKSRWYRPQFVRWWMTKSLFGSGHRLFLIFALFARLLIQLRHLLSPTFAWNVQKSRTASYLPFALLFASAAKFCFWRAIPVAWFRQESPSCKCLALSRSFVSFDFFGSWFAFFCYCVVLRCAFRLPDTAKIAIRLLTCKKL